ILQRLQLSDPVAERQQLLLDARGEAQLSHPLERGAGTEGDRHTDHPSDEQARHEARPGAGHQGHHQRPRADAVALASHDTRLGRMPNRHLRRPSISPTSIPSTRHGRSRAKDRCSTKWLGSGTGAAVPAPPEGRPAGAPGTVTAPKAVLATTPDSRSKPLGWYRPKRSTPIPAMSVQ